MTVAPNIAMEISASLSVDDRSVSARSTDTEPDAADGMDERIVLAVVDLAAHAADIDVDDVGGRIEMEIPHVLQQHGAGDDLALVANQIFEHLEFPRQQLDVAAAAAHRARHQVHLEIADPQHRFLHDGGAAPAERLHASQQFREGKRLDEIVVAAGAQAAYAIVDLAECADDQGGRRDAVFPQSPDDRDAVHARQHA